MPPEVELCAIQLPGREDRYRELPFTDIRKAASAIAGALYPEELSGPFALYGHSMGALIAYELSRVLSERYGIRPLHLFVSARIAPHVIDLRPPLYSLPQDELIERLRMLEGTPEEFLSEADPTWLSGIRADLRLSESYCFQNERPLAIPLTAFAGARDPYVAPKNVEAWLEHTSEAFSFRTFDDGHFFPFTQSKSVIQTILYGLAKSAVR